MSCCKCPGNCCPSKCATWLPRIGFGVMMIGFGVAHYRDMGTFVEMTKSPLASVPFLAMIAGLLAYVIPALEIVGGALFAVRQLNCIAKTCLLATFGGIMGWAGLGMAMATDQQTAMMMGTAFQGSVVALLGYSVIKKMGCCGKGMMPCGSGACGTDAKACGCGKGGACACPTGK